MSAEKNKGGPAVQPVRMDQEFQLQNLRRLAMNQGFESMGQYADAYTSPANNGCKDIASSAQSGFGQGTCAYMETNVGVQAPNGTTELAKASINNVFPQQAIEPQIQSNSASPAGPQDQGSGMFAPKSTLGAIGSEYDTWKMTTSPPRLFMTPRELGGSTHGISDESSVGTRASSGAFSLISGDDERLTATDNPVRVPRSAAVIPENPVWSDPNPNGLRYYQCPDVSPTPAGRSGLLGRAPSLISRLNFAAESYIEEDARSSKSPSGVSDVIDVQSQAVSLYDAAGSTGMYSRSSPAPSANDVTIKPRLRRRIQAAVGNGIVTSEHYTPAHAMFPQSCETRYQQGLSTPLGFGQMGNNMAYPGVNMTNMALASASGYAGQINTGLGGYRSPHPAAATRPPVLGSPIVMTRPSPAPFRPGTAFGNGNPTTSLPAPAPSKGAQSPLLAKLLCGLGGGSIATKLLGAEYFPFVETARDGGGPVNHGVIKFTNVPFEIGRNEVFAFLGRNSRVLHDNMEPIHIIMCRVTGKTLDIFVEVQTPADAARAVERHLDNCAAGRPSKLGDRQVDLQVSDQAELMKVLFPKAHAVQWVGNVPAVPERLASPYQTFRGFLSDEELTMMVKHVENPARCPFSRGCPERSFECLIGTLKKFPWDKTKHITLGQRYRIFQTTYKLIDILKKKVDRGIHPVRLTTSLLKRLIAVTMTCPGFTVLQKADIADLIGLEGDRIREFGQPRFGDRWRHQYSTSVKAGVPSDLVEWYISLIAKETKENIDANFSLREHQEIQRLASGTDDYWGHFWLELNLPNAKTLDDMTLHGIAEREFAVIEEILRRAGKKMAGGGAMQH